MNRDDIIEIISRKLEPKRVRHCLGVEEYALKLADRYDEDRAKASTAALLHDIMRAEPRESMPGLARGYGIEPSEYELENPICLHAPLAAAYAEQELGITDGDILKAIALHTTAAPAMHRLGKIIFISDAVEPNRVYDDADRLRRLSMESLDGCLLEVIKGSIELMEAKGRIAHPLTYAAYDYYDK